MKHFHEWIDFIKGSNKRAGTSLKHRGPSFKQLSKSKIWVKVLAALMLGVLVGILLGPDVNLIESQTSALLTDWLALPGNLFLQLIKMIIVPLVFSSIILGIISSGKPEFLKKIGPRLAVYFLITTTIATLIGFGIVFFIQPGSYIDVSSLSAASVESVPFSAESFDVINLPKAIVSILPSNPLDAMVRGDMLGVVIFTIIIGIALLFARKEYLDFSLNVLEVIQDISMRIVSWAMRLVPIAVFGLMTQVTSKIGFGALKGLAMYMITVIIGLLILLMVYNIIVLIFAKRNPFTFMKKIRNVQLLAFSTSSSAAVMPLSMKTAEDDLKVRASISEFLIPVGATVNMDGTALYQVIATVFLAQAFGVELSFLSMLMIIALTVGASIGAPSAPGTGIVILATILESVGIPAAGLALILGVDRILDMCRTTVNVTGDLTACVFFNEKLSYMFEKKKDEGELPIFSK